MPATCVRPLYLRVFHTQSSFSSVFLAPNFLTGPSLSWRCTLPAETKVKKASGTLAASMSFAPRLPPYSAEDPHFLYFFYCHYTCRNLSCSLSHPTPDSAPGRLWLSWPCPNMTRQHLHAAPASCFYLFYPPSHGLSQVLSGAPWSSMQASYCPCLTSSMWDGSTLSLEMILENNSWTSLPSGTASYWIHSSRSLKKAQAGSPEVPGCNRALSLLLYLRSWVLPPSGHCSEGCPLLSHPWPVFPCSSTSVLANYLPK